MRRKNNLDEMMFILYELNRNTDLMMSILNDMNSIKYKADKISCNDDCYKNKNHYKSARSTHKNLNDTEDDMLYKIKKFLIKLNC